MKAICYSLFGYNKERNINCFDFNSYLRGLLLNIRLNKLLFPDWAIILQTDQSTYNGLKPLFDNLVERRYLKIQINADAPLTKAMLWRLKPIFEIDDRQIKVYSHVLCRDLDSPPTYREAQAVQYWMNRDKAVHAITDSVSHTLPLMGGMIGFVPKYFTMLTGYTSWEGMFDGKPEFDFSKKNTDQSFLNKYIYPVFATKGKESITQHYFKGHGDTFLDDFKTCVCESIIGHTDNCPNNMDLAIPAALKETNAICGHIGAAGHYTTTMFQFLRKYWHEFDALLEIEKEYPKIFNWIYDAEQGNW